MNSSVVEDTIKKQINSHKIVLYMKGNIDFPLCGFSAKVIKILSNQGVEFITFDVLENEDIRQGIKEYSSWPTVPQLYVNGEFIGGCDIVCELLESGELAKLLN